MHYVNNKAEDVQIAYIGGGSRGWAWTFMTDLAREERMSGTIRLYDIDRKASENNAIIGNHISEKKEAVGKWKYEVYDTLKDALTGADFVVISIMPGTFDEMAYDVHMPERLGIYQSVGDTAGPGGIIRALRGYLEERKNGIKWRPKPKNCEIRVYEYKNGRHKFLESIK